MRPSLCDDVPPTRPIPEQEVFLNVLRTADLLGRGLEELLKPSGLSPTQYNALRIIRGAGDAGIPCGHIGDRMITRDPDITRLLDRLAKRRLITRRRQADDRRVVKAFIAPDGQALLKSLDKPVLDLHRSQLAALGDKKLATLALLLVEASSSLASALEAER